MSQRALVVDDDRLIRRLARETLESLGYQVEEASDGGVGFEVCQAFEPHLVLLDTWLPREDGQRLCKYLRDHNPQARVVLLSATTPEDQNPGYLASFAQGRLTKPFSPDELRNLVQAEALTSLAEIASERRRLERERREMDRVRESFLSLLSHELRTPLTIVSGNLHLLKKMLAELEEVPAECLGAAISGTQRLGQRLQELLNFSHQQALQIERWDLSRTIKTLVAEHEPLARSRQIQVELDLTEAEIQGDPLRLRDALSHLIKNAILFNRFGGKMWVALHEDDQGVVVQVRDQGSGIAPEDQAQVFQPFFQVEAVNTRTVEGLGLGLSIARKAVEDHRGQLELQSRRGEGTTLIIRLPSEAAVAGSSERFSPQSPPQHADLARLRDYAQELYELYDAERVRRLHAEEQQRALEQTMIGTLAALVKMVDPRDSGLLSQGERVLEYAKAVARQMDPTLPDQNDFVYSLLLYDIGKIGVAESVLHKAGRLSDTERKRAQAHAAIGADLLGSVKSLGQAIDGVRSHHERWDGSGYPDGLKGNEIPLTARIIAVVDSFDAMTVNRPYREALAPEVARREIEKEAGSHFDPAVVEAFVAAWPEIEAIALTAAGERRPPEPIPQADS